MSVKTAIFLTAAAIKKLKAGAERQEIRDLGAQSLYLVIQPKSGHKSFATRFRDQRGKPVKLTLGPVDLGGAEPTDQPSLAVHLDTPLTLSMARTLVAEVHRQRALGRDVVADCAAIKRRRRTVEETITDGYASVARRFIDEYAMVRTRKWRVTARHLGLAYPKHGGAPEIISNSLAERWTDRPISEIDSDLIWVTIDEVRRLGVPGLERRSRGPTEVQARMALAALSSMFTWAAHQRMIKRNPCLGVYRPKPPTPRDRVLDNIEIIKFWAAAETERVEVAVALKLLLLTGGRLNEVAGMRFSELSADLTVWTLPGTRTKNKRAHIVPLPPLARRLLATVPRIEGCDYVVTAGGRTPVPVNSWGAIKQRLDLKMQTASWRLHDLRRSFVTHVAELGIRGDTIELLINHRGGSRGGIAGVYNRSELLPERKAALERWADHLEGLVTNRSATVTPLRA
jgi:integrase